MRQCPKCKKRFLESNARICDVDGAVLDLIVVASERDRLVGTTILNKYTIDGVLGDGGMGVVYRAQDRSNKRFAVKVLRAEYSAEAELVARFEQEAKASAAIRNPHIVDIHEWGSLPDGSRFFVMEYLQGKSLGDVMARMPKTPSGERRQGLPEDFALHISMQIAEGLAAAHKIGIVHRDIKPDNFHIVKRPEDPYFVKILDFGIAKVQNSKAARTRTGSVFGTPHYMSPEQASGERNIDHTTDIYGLGVMMYEMVAGKVPFDAENLMGILTAHLYHAPLPPRAFPEVKVSASFEAVILKCLAKARDARYASMAELYGDLRRIREGRHARALEDQQDQRTIQMPRPSFPGGYEPEDGETRPGVMLPEARASMAPRPPGSPGPTVRTSSPPRPSMPGAAATAPSMPPFGAQDLVQESPTLVQGPSMPGLELDPSRAYQPTPTTTTLSMSRIRSRAPLIAGVLGSGTAIGFALFALVGVKSAAPAFTVLRPTAPQPSAPVLEGAPMGPSAVPSVPPMPLVNPVGEPLPPVLIESVTPGAVVFRGRQRIGPTPVRVVRPASGDDTYDVVAPGYERSQVTVGPSTPVVLRVDLDARDGRGPRRTARSNPRATPDPTPAPRPQQPAGPQSPPPPPRNNPSTRTPEGLQRIPGWE
ncbi:MAG: protein kinase [Deltaproteobacteria bacterium]|nr:protein kinase [Deltaproteobacteria bacterium]